MRLFAEASAQMSRLHSRPPPSSEASDWAGDWSLEGCQFSKAEVSLIRNVFLELGGARGFIQVRDFVDKMEEFGADVNAKQVAEAFW